MRILHLWKSDQNAGGGAIVMNRLHRGLRKCRVDSRILCEKTTTESPYITTIKPWRRTENILKQITSRIGLNDIHRLSSFRIQRHEAFQKSDLLHFHGTHSGFFNYLALPSITKRKPTVFTLHDMWALSGHCAVSYDCERWKRGCGKCPYPDSNPPIKRDATRLEWKLKKWAYARSNITLVTLSNWQTEQVNQSMLNDLPINLIPNGVDTDVYRPLDGERCKSMLGIPADKHVLMVGASNLNVYWKGGDLLMKSLHALPKSLKARLFLILLGNGGEGIAQSIDIPSLSLGYVSNDQLKSICYSSADLFLHPTRADTLSLVLQESMACGTPMVSYRVGGVPDLVRPKVTGYLAEPGNTSDFHDGIVRLIEDDSLRHDMGKQCRTIALKEYTLGLQIQRHIELYQTLLRKEGIERGEDS